MKTLAILVCLVTITPSVALAQAFPQGSRGPQNPNGQRTMQVIMQDGSVRTIVTGGGQSGGIDPRVLEQIRNSGRAGDGNGIMPGMEARPTPQGLPARVNTFAGLDPEIQRLWNMEQNWRAGTGELMYSYQAIRVQGSRLTPAQIYERLRTFELFNVNESNVAEVRLMQARRDIDPNFAHRQWALFRAKSEYPGLVGVLNGLQEFVNSRWVPVELFNDPRNMSITAVTMGDHMIVGSRRWTVKPQADGSILIETEAWEQRNGSINDTAMTTGVPGVMSGKEVMALVWDVYLQNIGRAVTRNGGTFDYAEGTNGRAGLWRELPAGTRNPFRAGLPGSGVPGPAVPNGHYGPGWTPPAPPARRVAVTTTQPPAGVDVARVPVLLRGMSTIQCHGPQCNSNSGFNLSLTGFGAPAPGNNAGRFQNTQISDADREILRGLLRGAPAGGGTSR